MHNDLERILITESQLKERVNELGKTLSADYEGKTPLMLCILKGSTLFYADLIRAMDIPVECDFIAVSSYGNKTKSSGEVKMIKDLDKSIEGKHVVIVEDIVDSGYTLTYLKKNLLARGPASVKICALLDKEERREVPITPEYKGFSIDDYFVVGYGLDYNERYRNFPEIGILKPSVYMNK